MPLMRVALPWDRKPNSSEDLVIDWDNPINRGLAVADGDPRVFRDLTGHHAPNKDETSSFPMPAIGVHGPCIRNNVAVQTKRAYYIQQLWRGTDQVTCLSFFRYRTTTGNSWAVLNGVYRSGFNVWALSRRADSGGNPYKPSFGVSTTTGGNSATGAALADTDPHVCMGRYDGANVALWVDGKPAASSPLTGTMNDTNQYSWQVNGGHTGDGYNTDTDIFLSLAWTRALTDQEMRSISRNPWQIFKPKEVYVVDFVVAGQTVPFNVGDFSIVGNKFILSEQFNFNTAVGVVLGKIMAVGEGISFGPGLDVYYANPMSINEGVAFSVGSQQAAGSPFSIGETIAFAPTGGFTSSPFALQEGIEMAQGGANITSFPFSLVAGEVIGFELGVDAILGSPFTVTQTDSISFGIATAPVTGKAFSLSVGNSVAFNTGNGVAAGSSMSAGEQFNFHQGVDVLGGFSFGVSESQIIPMSVGADSIVGSPMTSAESMSMTLGSAVGQGFTFDVSESNNIPFAFGSGVTQGQAFISNEQIVFSTAGLFTTYPFGIVVGSPPLIDGQLTHTLNINGGSVQLYFNGIDEYFVIDSTTEV